MNIPMYSILSRSRRMANCFRCSNRSVVWSDIRRKPINPTRMLHHTHHISGMERGKGQKSTEKNERKKKVKQKLQDNLNTWHEFTLYASHMDTFWIICALDCLYNKIKCILAVNVLYCTAIFVSSQPKIHRIRWHLIEGGQIDRRTVVGSDAAFLQWKRQNHVHFLLVFFYTHVFWVYFGKMKT